MRISVCDCKWNLESILKSKRFSLWPMNETKLQLILVDNPSHLDSWFMRIVGVKILRRSHVESFRAIDVFLIRERAQNLKRVVKVCEASCTRVSSSLKTTSKMRLSSQSVIIWACKFPPLTFSLKRFSLMQILLMRLEGSSRRWSLKLEVRQHQRRTHATLNSALMSNDSANKSQNIQRHHRQSAELINSFSCDNSSPTTSQKSESRRWRHLSILFSIQMFLFDISSDCEDLMGMKISKIGETNGKSRRVIRKGEGKSSSVVIKIHLVVSIRRENAVAIHTGAKNHGKTRKLFIVPRSNFPVKSRGKRSWQRHHMTMEICRNIHSRFNTSA